jgi:uncharacterized damage-inducible protein DinB
MDATAHFTTLARYNGWATERLLKSVDTLAEADYRRNLGLFFKSIHGTLNHLLVGEHRPWFRRFSEGVSPQVRLDAEAETDRVALAQCLRDGAARWSPMIRTLPPERFVDTLSYTTMRGQLVTLPYAATLAHVFNHATHHRGQITAALTSLGQPCPELDLVYFLQLESATL